MKRFRRRNTRLKKDMFVLLYDKISSKMASHTVKIINFFRFMKEMSCFLRKKQDLLVTLHSLKDFAMVISTQIKEVLSRTQPGVVLTISDFGVQAAYQPALVKALNRLVTSQELQKISKGKYYKPRKTIFGELKPDDCEIVKDFLEKRGKTVGYITGTAAFAAMGLTTQITSAITIGTNKYRRPLMRGAYKVTFLLQPNEITEVNIPLLRILDAIRLIREIPATTPDESVAILMKLIRNLDEDSQKKLIKLALPYTQYVRALLGAMLESIGKDAGELRETLNGVTSYKLSISEPALQSKSNWNII